MACHQADAEQAAWRSSGQRPTCPQRQRRRGARFRPLVAAASDTAIWPLVIGDNAAALAAMAHLHERGVWVLAIRPPSVPVGTARLRIALSAAHRDADADELPAALHAVAGATSNRSRGRDDGTFPYRDHCQLSAFRWHAGCLQIATSPASRSEPFNRALPAAATSDPPSGGSAAS